MKVIPDMDAKTALVVFDDAEWDIILKSASRNEGEVRGLLERFIADKKSVYENEDREAVLGKIKTLDPALLPDLKKFLNL